MNHNTTHCLYIKYKVAIYYNSNNKVVQMHSFVIRLTCHNRLGWVGEGCVIFLCQTTIPESWLSAPV